MECDDLDSDEIKFSDLFYRDLGHRLCNVSRELMKNSDCIDRRRKFRSLLFNMKKNKYLLIGILEGEISPTELIEMNAEQLRVLSRKDLDKIEFIENEQMEGDELDFISFTKGIKRSESPVWISTKHKKRRMTKLDPTTKPLRVNTEKSSTKHKSHGLSKTSSLRLNTFSQGRVNRVEELAAVIDKEEELFEKELAIASKASYLNDRFRRIEKSSGKKGEKKL